MSEANKTEHPTHMFFGGDRVSDGLYVQRCSCGAQREDGGEWDEMSLKPCPNQREQR